MDFLPGIDFHLYFDPIRDILIDHPGGVSEYELLGKLIELGYSEFNRQEDGGDLGLFQSHFLLFHALYRFQDHIRESGSGDLHIHCLDIRFKTGVISEKEGVILGDPMRQYYLNLENLYQTGESDVRDMLDRFWKRYTAREHVREALEELELDESVSFDEIQKRYRAMAFERHPDRGGAREDLVRLNLAKETLDRFYG